MLVEEARSELAWVGVVDPDSGDIEPRACCAGGERTPVLDEDGGDSTLGRPLLQEALRTPGPGVLVDDVEVDSTSSGWRERARRAGLRSVAAVPVAAAGRIEGALALCARHPGAYGRDEGRLLESVAAHLGMALRTYRLEDEHERQAEQLRRRGHELRERVKELRCLLDLSRLADRLESSPEALYQEAVELIPPAWQHPEITCARLRLGDDEYVTDGFEESPWRLAAAVVSGDEELGRLEVLYREERPLRAEGPFLAEEPSLLDALAERVGKIAVRFRTEAALERSEERYRRLQEDHRRFLDCTVDGGKRMKKLISDLLSCSRVATHGEAFVPVDLEALLDDVRRNLAKRIEESGAEVTSGSLPVIAGDARQIYQLLQNLVANAIRFHGEEAPRVHVSGRRTDAGWQIAVRDNGIGIAPEHQERIFQIFQRIHGRNEYPGTGLGLALCRRIVQRHGGAIGVESRPGEGATFHFTVPDPREDHLAR